MAAGSSPAGRMRKKPGAGWLGNTLLVVTSVAFVLGVLEIAARLATRGGGGKEAGETNLYHQYDPLLGWAKKPGARLTYRRREYTVEVAINRRGLRDPERDYRASPGTLRILALGDSFLEGYTVPLEDTVTQKLERSLRSAGMKADVLNAGTAAYSTDQEYLYYQSEGVRYDPRVVLVFFYYNDIVYNDRQDYFGLPKPIFEERPDGLHLHRYPVREPGPRTASISQDETSVSGSALYAWLRDRLWYRAPRTYEALSHLGLWPPLPRLAQRLELRVYQKALIPEIEDAWGKTAAILGALSREVAARGQELLVVYVPSRMEVDDRSWELSQSLYGMDAEGWDRGLVAARLSRVGRDQGFPVLDLTTALREADRGWLGRPYFTYDGHWTSLGHETAAREIEQVLRREHWLGKAWTPRREVRGLESPGPATGSETASASGPATANGTTSRPGGN